MKSKRTGSLLMLFGGVLIAAALLLLAFNSYEAKKAEKAARQLLPQVCQQIDVRKQEPTHKNPYDEQADEMTCIEIDRYEYIGYLSIPVLDLELPIMSEWDYPRLKIAPCRQFGSTKSDDLVIAGHNYRRHFGKLNTLKINDLMQFVDMDGEVSFYKVGEVNVIAPDSLEQVKNSDWDLVLYTCNYQGDKRVMVGGARITGEEAKELLGQN